MSDEAFDFAVVGLGALGSAACRELALRGHRVVGLEQFPLGHSRGASHDTSRILRHSYHTPAYVRMTQQAYADWARLERACGAALVTTVGGLDLFPPDAAIDPEDYVASLTEVGVPFSVLDAGEVARRWPQFRLPEGTQALHQEDAAIVPAARGTATMQAQAVVHGAVLRAQAPVTDLRESDAGVQLTTPGGVVAAGGVVVCADAWTNQVLAPLGVSVPLEVTLEQVTYFRPDDVAPFLPGRQPLWIWMDDPCFYGFPAYGEPTVKVAEDCGGPSVDPDDRTSEVDPVMEQRVADHLAQVLPGAGPPVRSLRCQYTLTPDRDFVVSRVPGHPAVTVGLGAAHGFKFAPTLGRLLADVATGSDPTVDLAPFRLERRALTDPAYRAHWLV